MWYIILFYCVCLMQWGEQLRVLLKACWAYLRGCRSFPQGTGVSSTPYDNYLCYTHLQELTFFGLTAQRGTESGGTEWHPARAPADPAPEAGCAARAASHAPLAPHHPPRPPALPGEAPIPGCVRCHKHAAATIVQPAPLFFFLRTIVSGATNMLLLLSYILPWQACVCSASAAPNFWWEFEHAFRQAQGCAASMRGFSWQLPMLSL